MSLALGLPTYLPQDDISQTRIRLDRSMIPIKRSPQACPLQDKAGLNQLITKEQAMVRLGIESEEVENNEDVDKE